MDTFSFKAPVLLLVNENAFEALLGLFRSEDAAVDEDLSTKTGGYFLNSSKYG